MSDSLASATVTVEERNALALARSELQMLSDLVQLRRTKGLSQQDVADAIGRDNSAISRFERLDSDPRLSTIRRYARAVGAMVSHEVVDFSRQAPRAAGETSNVLPASNVDATKVAEVADIAAAMARRADAGRRLRGAAASTATAHQLQALEG